MDEVHEFCVRVLDNREAAARAVALVRQDRAEDRLQELARAVAACRRVAGDGEAGAQPARGPGEPARGPGEPAGGGAERRSGSGALAAAIAGELASASARLPQRQREALALAERLDLTHEQLAGAIGIEPAAAAPLLARARLRLRHELRGAGAVAVAGDCPERDRALVTIARRQDGEEVAPADDDWLLEHLGHCLGCSQAHAAMLEASVCYRAWRISVPST